MTDLTPEERAALDALVPPDQQTGQLHDDLVAAARVTWTRRVENSELGGKVIGALHRDVKSWRIVEYATGIPSATARRWAAPPKLAPAQPNEEASGSE
jgi:carboxylesterase type B